MLDHLDGDATLCDGSFELVHYVSQKQMARFVKLIYLRDRLVKRVRNLGNFVVSYAYVLDLKIAFSKFIDLALKLAKGANFADDENIRKQDDHQNDAIDRFENIVAIGLIILVV